MKPVIWTKGVHEVHSLLQELDARIRVLNMNAHAMEPVWQDANVAGYRFIQHWKF